MSQHDMNLANASGASFRADANLALVALVSNGSGATEPATMFAYQYWADTTTDTLKQRNSANTAWISLFTMSTGAPIVSPVGVMTLAGVETVTGRKTFTAPQRGTVTTNNTITAIDCDVTNFVFSTPGAGAALTFTNIPSGQGGTIKFVNGANYAITAAATTKVTSTFLATISATGTYIISYFSDGTNVYCSTAGAMA